MIKSKRLFVLFCLSLTISSFCQTQVLEAEKGVLAGTQVATQRTGYSGTGYVTGFDADGDKVTMMIDLSTSGVYNLYIRYAAPFGEKYNFVYANNVNLGAVHFAPSNTFGETLVGKIYLDKGSNTIAIVKEWGYFELDNIRLEKTLPSEINHVATDLVIPNPSSATTALYGFLSKTYGKVILSGQYGGDIEFNRIKSVSGKTPLIRGFDLIEYSPSRVAHGATSTETENAIAWYGQKGIVTFAWHWNAPKDLIDQPGKEWWRGFYTEATTFDVTKTMNNTASEEYTLIIRDIDAIAVQLKKLKDANVPVLWRPLHEAEGAWFWWGAKGPEPCKWLWKVVFDRLVNYHQLDNLIWVWTSTASPAAADWYPGDDYVDIIGADIYLPAGTYTSNFIMFDNLASIFGGKKIITLSENGPMPDAERLFIERAAWNWFCTWGGSFITDGLSNSAAHINTVFNHEYVITLDELDNVDAIIADLDEKREALDDDEVVLGSEDQIPKNITYQNPIQNNGLAISAKNGQSISKVIIYNIQGKVEFSREDTGNKNSFDFDFSLKASGMYIAKIYTSKGTRFIRFIKP
jgi:mannan endo-1,4-beta-mannosidase